MIRPLPRVIGWRRLLWDVFLPTACMFLAVTVTGVPASARILVAAIGGAFALHLYRRVRTLLVNLVAPGGHHNGQAGEHEVVCVAVVENGVIGVTSTACTDLTTQQKICALQAIVVYAAEQAAELTEQETV
jgi:hypothetical protein